MRQADTQFFELFRIGCTNDRTDCGIAGCTDLFCTPSFAHIAHDIINGVFTDFLVLQFAAGRVGSLDQNEDTLVPFCTDIQQRTDAVCAEIAVDGQSICSERF